MRTIKTIKKAVLLLIVATVIVGGSFAEAQITILKDKSGKTRTFLAGKISMPFDYDSVETKYFVCKLLVPLKKGDYAAMTSEDQAWSIQKESMEIGKQKENFSVMAMAKANDGVLRTFFPAWMEFKIDIPAGKTIKEGFHLQIEATRSIKAGNRIPVILFGWPAVMSVESEEGEKKSNSAAQPWLIVHAIDLSANDRSALIDIWQIATQHIRK